MALIGILIALALLIYLAYRGVGVLLLAPLLALLAAFASGAPLLASYTQVFMPAVGGFIVAFFPLFLLGAVFGKLIEASGSAAAVAHGFVATLGARRAILAVVLACAVLTYGGVSLFVVAFAVYPIAAELFRASAIPYRLVPAAIALGAFTFTMTALPGTPAIQNAIPMPYFRTTPFAAPGLGLIASFIMFGLGMLWLERRVRRAARTGGGDRHDEASEPLQQGTDAPRPGFGAAGTLPTLPAATLPVVLVVALNYLFSAYVLPRLDTRYLAALPYGPVALHQVLGVWSIASALFLSILVLLALHWRRLSRLRMALDEGAEAAVLPVFNTASLVGFGTVIASLPAFGAIRDAVLGIAPGNPLISLAIAVNILAGITGSASGGLSIALRALGADYLALAAHAGIAPQLLHRVTTIATGGLDALPHNGAVVTLLSICRLTHREAYPDIFMVAVAGPLVALAAVIVCGTLWGAF